MNNENREEMIPFVESDGFNERREKGNFSQLGLSYALFSIITLFVSLAIQIVAGIVSPELLENVLFLNIITPVSMYLFALPILLLSLGGMKAEPPEKKKIGFWKWAIFLLIGFGFMYIGNYIGQGVMTAISQVVGHDYSNGLISLIEGDTLWIPLIFVVIIAPIGEEFVFRKLIIDRTRKYGGFVCVLLSGLIFGLMHGNFYQLFYAIALGLILGYVYYSTGKLYLSILIHAIINFFGSIVPNLLLDGINFMNEDMSSMSETGEAFLAFLLEHGPMLMFSMALALFIVVAMVCAIVLPIVLRKRIKLDKGRITIPKEKIKSVVFLNVGIIVLIVVYAVEFVLALIP